MQNRPCDVSPSSDQDKYTIALANEQGQWWGLDVPFSSIFEKTNNASPPLQRVGINSFHAGRGVDRFSQGQYAFYDSRNGWPLTPGKFHAAPLMRWAKGLRSADFNMPNAAGVVWYPLRKSGTTKYLDVSFQASATYTAAKLILILRRQVPAGTVGSPGTLTARIRTDSAGNPSTVVSGTATVTVTSSDMTDVASEYYIFTISVSLTSGTTYHITVNGGSSDIDGSCWEIGCDPTAAGKRSSDDSSWTATTYSPYYRITDADVSQTFRQFIWDNALYLVSVNADGSTASKLYINGCRGRAVGTQSSTTLVDTGHGSYGATTWPVDRFAGCYIRIIRGTGRGQVRLISSNTADTFTVSTAWDITPVAADSEYVVYSSDWFVEITTTGLGVVTADPTISNGIVYFPQGDSTNIRIMRMDYSATHDHGFDVESTNNNKAYYLTNGFAGADGPVIWRANRLTATGTPTGLQISVARAQTTPAGVAVPFGTDLSFRASIPCGDNTNLINGIIFHENILNVLKEDCIYQVANDAAQLLKIGADSAPDQHNGRAACVASDKQLYIGWDNDVYLITPGGAYPTGMKTNLPSNRSGYVADLEAAKGWIFAAVDAGSSGYSSIMHYAVETKAWCETLRGFAAGRRIRTVQWQNCPETRPRLWVEIGGEMVFQEYPINGVRPYDDSGMKYHFETHLILPTIDLFTTDSKYFAVLTVTTQGLATGADTESGHEIVVEFQADNDVGSSTWYHAGKLKVSPSGQVEINQGGKRMIRLRLRLISTEATDPVIIETISLSLFSRNKLSNEWTFYFKLTGDDDEQNSLQLLRDLRKMARSPEKYQLLSKFRLYHERWVTISDEPRYKVEEVDTEDDEIEATISISVQEIGAEELA